MSSKLEKPVAPNVYTSATHPGICMSSNACKTKEDFFKLFKGTRNAKGADLNKEWLKFKTWRSKFK